MTIDDWLEGRVRRRGAARPAGAEAAARDARALDGRAARRRPRVARPRPDDVAPVDDGAPTCRSAQIVAARSQSGRACRRSISSASCLARIEARPELNAFITVMREQGAGGRAAAAEQEIAAGRYRGPLHGIPVSVKDLVDVAGTPTTSGSARAAAQPARGRAGRHAAARGRRDHHRQDQPARVRVRHDQRGIRVRTRAPSARSVAIGRRLERRRGRRAGRGHVLRRRSAPTPAVDPHPVGGVRHGRPEADATESCRAKGSSRSARTLDHVGPMARTVADARADVPGDEGGRSEPRRRRCGSPDVTSSASRTRTSASGCDPDVRAALARTREALARAGHEVRTVDDRARRAGPPTSTCTSCCRKRRGITRRCWTRTRIAIRRACGCGSKWADTSWRKTTCARCACARCCRRGGGRALEGCDALLLPTLPIPAPPLGAATVDVDGTPEPVRAAMLRLTQLFNITGHPAIALPAGTTDDGWPVSMQLVGAARRHRPAARDGRGGRALHHRRRRIGRRRHRVNVRPIFRLGIPGGTGTFGWGGWLMTSGGCGTSGFGGCSIMHVSDATRLPVRKGSLIDRSSLSQLGAAARGRREHRIVRPFEWGLDWIDGLDGSRRGCRRTAGGLGVADASPTATRSSRSHPCDDYTLDGDRLSFPSAVATPHPENNTVRARYFPDALRARPASAPSSCCRSGTRTPEGHVGLCRLLNRFGISALRLSLPYHDARMPPELRRADYIVSANVGRTAQVCRQAVLDARRAIAWLSRQGYESIGILGTSLGLVPGDAHGRARAAGQGRRAQSHLAVLRRRHLGRAVDRARPRRARRHDRSRDAAADLDADLAVPVPRAHARQAGAARLRAVRPDVSGHALEDAGRTSSGGAASITRSPCCRAATTAPA